MRKCKECGVLKDSKNYYGVQRECKECTKKRVRLREQLLREDPAWVEKEQERQREKYKRLDYNSKQKDWDKDKPWKSNTKYKNLSRKFKTPKGYELHHWNYNDDFLEDVITLKIKQHRKAHTHLTLDFELKIFRNSDGNILATKEDHIQYLINKGILF